MRTSQTKLEAGPIPNVRESSTALCVKRGVPVQDRTTCLYVATRGVGQQPSRRTPCFKERGAAPTPAELPYSRHRRSRANSPYKECAARHERSNDWPQGGAAPITRTKCAA